MPAPSAAVAPTDHATAPARPRPAQDGALPQTSASPSANSSVLDRESAALWDAVRTGDAGRALPAFFPVAAYVQVKTVARPAADWRTRLFGRFALDVAAAHRLLGAEASTAQLLRVTIPSSAARWIPPGACANRVGYWHVGGARLVYRSADQVRSFGIASLISWRGRWYVVHLGAVRPRTAGGIVDRPALGPGTVGPTGGC